ncbi:MAG: PEP-CTERM sorting domain-containing protein [Candidatus Methylopumilus sp.]|jgi:hypothetical protein
MHTTLLVAIAAAASLFVTESNAATVYDNGGIGFNTSYCDSGPNTCSGYGNWTIYDNFTLDSAAVITGLANWNSYGNPSDYVSTNWSIWSSDPRLGGAPLAFDNATATISSDSGLILTTLSNLSVTLSAGNYWVGFNHQVSTDTPWTYVSSASGLMNAFQMAGTSPHYDNLPDAAFRLYTSAVPEPGSTALFLAGLAVVGSVARRRTAIR